MILPHINHKMPIYRDCTFSEIMLLGIGSLLVLASVFSFLTKLLLGFFWIGFILSLLSLVPVIRLLTARLQKVKYGKPYGYYQQLFVKKLSQSSFLSQLLKIPFVQRQGKWSVRRK